MAPDLWAKNDPIQADFTVKPQIALHFARIGLQITTVFSVG